MKKNFKKLFLILTRQERIKLLILLILTIITATLEVAGIASIIPFMAVLADPALIDNNLLLNKFFKISSIFGINTPVDFFYLLGFFVFIFFIVSLTFKSLTYYYQFHLLGIFEYSVSQRLLKNTLNQSYSWFLLNHSSNIGKNILSEVSYVTTNGIKQMLEIISKSIVFIFIISLVILVNPKIALISCLFIVIFYGLFSFFIKKYINKIGEQRTKSNELRYRVINEAFQSTKELKVRGLEKMYHKIFDYPAKNYSKTIALSSSISQLPRFILEGICFGGILLILLLFMKKNGSLANIIPILTMYVFAGYRLMPAAQQIFSSYTQLSFAKSAIDTLFNQIKNLKPFKEFENETTLSFKNEISLENICYNYPNTSSNILTDVSLKIPVGSYVGFVGATGSGKTTIVDIILGLLEPQKGTIKVDKNIICNQNVRYWWRLIGYVPQNIFLFDDTIAANIAFDTDNKKIDQERIIKVSKIANIHNFIMHKLPTNYQTKVGERGVNLSGGQIQRIGIARALYHNPQVLILDEATSALDNETEEIIQKNINHLKKDITIIVIAHRLNTVKNCDIIFKVNNGSIIDQSKYSELFSK